MTFEQWCAEYELRNHVLSPSVKKVMRKVWDYQQAKIDELMLEYCPEDMTDAQYQEWERHQKPVEFSGEKHA